MEDPSLTETAWDRAKFDWFVALRSVRFRLAELATGLAAVVAAALVVSGRVNTTGLIVVPAAMAMLSALMLAFLVLVRNLALTHRKQRDEARKRIQEIKGASGRHDAQLALNLAEFHHAARELQRRAQDAVRFMQDVPIDDINAWYAELVEYVSTEFGEVAAERLNTDATIPARLDAVWRAGVEPILDAIDDRARVLQDIIDEVTS